MDVRIKPTSFTTSRDGLPLAVSPFEIWKVKMSFVGIHSYELARTD
jgi:hypothetical protein